MQQLSTEMRACADLCQTCATTCFSEAMNHCLESGGKHTVPEHFQLMIACAEICKAAAAVLLTGIPQHVFVCHACAQICRACAQSCQRIGDMQDCVDDCSVCAEGCEALSATMQKAA
ncbi:hypothetical protein HYPP_00306 [Hyphomicrobium sp. ghe19]|nr:hypothetical protein HYPP_00306 [Hyphomicrobium sp. ghe19]